MLVDVRLTWPIVILGLLCVLFPFFDEIHFTIWGVTEVRFIENIQALLLLFFAVISYIYMRPLQLKAGQKEFWLWAVCWWILLFGRSTSWGRDYFPEIPKIYFRSISVVLIASVLFPLFQSNLRQELVRKFKTSIIPVWGVMFLVVGLIMSDAIEHHRWIGNLLIDESTNIDLLEELYEFPLILGLFMVAFDLMKTDKYDPS